MAGRTQVVVLATQVRDGEHQEFAVALAREPGAGLIDRKTHIRAYEASTLRSPRRPTNHAEADQDDMDTLLTLLGVAGAPFVIAVPGADDVMLGYQSLSFHDVLYLRHVLGLQPAPEFEQWLRSVGIADGKGRVLPIDAATSALRQLTSAS